MNLPVPDPILLTNSHDGLDGVSVLYLSLCSEAEVLCPVFSGQFEHIQRRVGFGSRNQDSHKHDDSDTPPL